MSDFLLGLVVFVARTVNFVLDLVTGYDRIKRAAVIVSGADKIVPVPADPRPLPPAAERALAEAEQRRASA